jgi:hypothetical protein
MRRFLIFCFVLMFLHSNAQQLVLSGDTCDNTPSNDFSYSNYIPSPHRYGYNIYRNDTIVYNEEVNYSDFLALGGLQFISDVTGFINKITGSSNGFYRSKDAGESWQFFSGFRITYLWDPKKFYNFYFISEDAGYMGLYTNDSIFLFRLPYSNKYGNPELLSIPHDSLSHDFILQDTLRSVYGCGQLNHLLFTWYLTDDTIHADLQFIPDPSLAAESKGSIICRVYPNPAGENIRIHMNTRDSYRITMRDIPGRVLSANTYPYSDEIVAEMPNKPGIYFLEINDSKGWRTIEKVIRE